MSCDVLTNLLGGCNESRASRTSIVSSEGRYRYGSLKIEMLSDTVKLGPTHCHHLRIERIVLSGVAGANNAALSVILYEGTASLGYLVYHHCLANQAIQGVVVPMGVDLNVNEFIRGYYPETVNDAVVVHYREAFEV